MGFKLTYQTIAGKTIEFSELKNEQYITVLKYITNDDDSGLSTTFNSIVDNVTNQAELTCVDKFYILCELRSVCIGDELQAQTAEFSGVIKLSINDITAKMKSVDLSEFIEVLPANISHSSYSTKDILKLDSVDELPATILTEISNVVKQINNITKTVNIFDGNKRIGMEPVPFNVFDGTLFAILKLIYKDDLLNFYKLMYKLSSKANISITQFLSLTPAESKMFMQFYIEEIKQQEDDTKKAMNQNGNMQRH